MVNREIVVSNLETLAKGMEILWDYVPSYVKAGVVTREEVLPYLRQCLQNVIPYYRQAVVSVPDYLGRLEEAGQALQAIVQGKPVKYRGITL